LSNILAIAQFEARSRPRAWPREAPIPPTTCESDCIRAHNSVHTYTRKRKKEREREGEGEGEGARERERTKGRAVCMPLRYVMQVPTWVPDSLRLSADFRKEPGGFGRGPGERRGGPPRAVPRAGERASERTVRQPFDSRDRDLVRAFCEIAVWRASAA